MVSTSSQCLLSVTIRLTPTIGGRNDRTLNHGVVQLKPSNLAHQTFNFPATPSRDISLNLTEGIISQILTLKLP